ncbi:2A76: homoserine/Threonine efflux protein [Sporomusa termitida]|uniref:2A76: homoserine/Threonine efflux protein n=2 Tax=Sporomusa termitida TaxID=2377 RepID=A0A517DQ43_9FIRM|nr:2A76: homoserine/Threonine efflux protein [Sporomusa termitida]
MGLLCIRRTLAQGLLSGCFSGLGTATADALYGCIAAFSLTAIATLVLEQQFYLRLFGGVFLLYLGYTAFTAAPGEPTAKPGDKRLLTTYISAFFLTLTNPLTIMSFAAVFAGLGLGEAGGNYQAAGVLVLGVFIGSMLWWLALSSLVVLLRSRFDHKRLAWINRLAGIIIAGFGLVSLIASLS